MAPKGTVSDVLRRLRLELALEILFAAAARSSASDLRAVLGPQLLNLLFDFLEDDAPLNSLLAGYFSKVRTQYPAALFSVSSVPAIASRRSREATHCGVRAAMKVEAVHPSRREHVCFT